MVLPGAWLYTSLQPHLSWDSAVAIHNIDPRLPYWPSHTILVVVFWMDSLPESGCFYLDWCCHDRSWWSQPEELGYIPLPEQPGRASVTYSRPKPGLMSVLLPSHPPVTMTWCEGAVPLSFLSSAINAAQTFGCT